MSENSFTLGQNEKLFIKCTKYTIVNWYSTSNNLNNFLLVMYICLLRTLLYVDLLIILKTYKLSYVAQADWVLLATRTV